MFEHASDARILLKLLSQTKTSSPKSINQKDFRYIRVDQEVNTSQTNGGLTTASSVSTNLSNLEEPSNQP